MESSKIIEQLFSLDGIKEEFIEKKLWGRKYNLCFNTNSRVDLLYMEKGGYTSVHSHKRKKNRLFCLHGNIEIRIYEKIKWTGKLVDDPEYKYTDSISSDSQYKIYDIQPGIIHQLFAVERSLILEIDMVKVDRDDITRFITGGIKK